MGSEPTDYPTNPTEEQKPQPNQQGSVPVNQTVGDGKAALESTTRETSPKSVFVNSEPMREDQVQNAVNFLSNPRVKGSPVMYRRSFLEKKGLTKEEIDEAFRRVPDQAPAVTTTQAVNPKPGITLASGIWHDSSGDSNQNVAVTEPIVESIQPILQDGQSNTTTSVQPHVSAQTQAPAVAAPTGVVSTMTTLRPAQFNWSQCFLGIGFLAASGVATVLLFKKAIVPRLKVWIRKVVLEEEYAEKSDSKPTVAEAAASAAKAAAAAAADAAKASQEIMNSKNEDKKFFESVAGILEAQMAEIRLMSNAVCKLERTKEVAISSVKQADEKLASVNVRPSTASVSVEPSVAPHPKSYMEIMAMVQRGEKPPGIKDINDIIPNPNQHPSNPRLAPRLKPWEVTGQVQNGSYNNGYYSGDNISSIQQNGDVSEPQWQRENVRITEVEPEDGSKVASYRAPANEGLNLRTWVPPTPPPIAMPEAAAAIRQQKPSTQREALGENQLIGRPSDDVDELERITEISESGGEVEIKMNEEQTVN